MSTIKPSRTTRITYPESDGKPMAENTLQFKWIVLIKEGLAHAFRDDPNVFVAGDLLWYPVEKNNKIRQAPDAMVVFGRPKGDRGAYLQWLEGGIGPQVVFEVLSPGNRPGEMTRKRKFYLNYGVEEYYEYFPDKGDLRGWLREGEDFTPVADMNGFVSPRLGIRFEPGTGGRDNLTILGPNGQPLLTYDQHAENAREEKLRADAANQREEAANQRAERLAAKLRELGVDPSDQ